MINIRSSYSHIRILRKILKYDLQATVYPNTMCLAQRFLHRGIHEDRGINKKIENRLRSQDNIGPNFRIIYRAPYVLYVKLTYGLAFISTLVVFPMIGTVVFNQGFGTYPLFLGDLEVVSSDLELASVICISALVVSQVCYTVFKYPFRIYCDSASGKYMAIYQHILPWLTVKEKFHAGEVKKVVKSYSIWQECLYKVKNRKTILIVESFTLPKDMNDMIYGKVNEGNN